MDKLIVKPIGSGPVLPLPHLPDAAHRPFQIAHQFFLPAHVKGVGRFNAPVLNEYELGLQHELEDANCG
jgi:hypothetical protein